MMIFFFICVHMPSWQLNEMSSKWFEKVRSNKSYHPNWFRHIDWCRFFYFGRYGFWAAIDLANRKYDTFFCVLVFQLRFYADDNYACIQWQNRNGKISINKYGLVSFVFGKGTVAISMEVTDQKLLIDAISEHEMVTEGIFIEKPWVVDVNQIQTIKRRDRRFLFKMNCLAEWHRLQNQKKIHYEFS